ncbi:MAG: hypothetical protein MHM6MM_003311 [Cercozoa sp. M6MM]
MWRPVTQHGVSGVATATGRRQVADEQLFVSRVRNQQNHVFAEIKRLEALREELRGAAMEATALRSQRQRWQQKVLNAEAELADYNLALDKARGDVDLDALEQQVDVTTNENAHYAATVDQLFLARNEAQSTAQSEAKKRAQLLSQLKERVFAAEGDAGKASRTIEQLEQVLHQLAHTNAEVSSSTQRVASMTQRTDVDSGMLRRLVDARRRISELTKRQQRLQHEEAQPRELSVQERRERIVSEARETNAELTQLTATIAEHEKQNEQLRSEVESLQQREREYAEFAKDAAKYSALADRSAKLDSFLREFEEKAPELQRQRSEGDQQLQKLQRQLTQMQAQHRHLQAVRGDPSLLQGTLAEARAQLRRKKLQRRDAHDTISALKEHVQLRQQEVQRMRGLDSRIEAELQGLADKRFRVQERRTEYAEFRNEARHWDEQEAPDARKHIKQLQSQVREVTSQHDEAQAKHGELTRAVSNEEAHVLKSLQKQLRNHKATLTELQDEVQSLRERSDCTKAHGTVTSLIGEINRAHCEYARLCAQ